MLVAGFPAGAFGTNCYAVAPGPGRSASSSTPAWTPSSRWRGLLAEDGLKPVAVVLTHGHLDHTFSVVPVCDGYDIPAYLHPADRGMLADPARWHGPPLARADVRRRDLPDPADVPPLDDGAVLSLAGVELTVRHAAGPHPRLGDVLPADPRPGGRRPPACSPATCCSPGRSAGSTCPAGRGTRCSTRCATSSCRWTTRPSCCPGTGRPPRSAGSARPTPTWPRRPRRRRAAGAAGTVSELRAPKGTFDIAARRTPHGSSPSARR